ncbi:DNA topoisomerase I, mitochondrial [Apodemus speciosus]|uniref:DNA topoisomerase I n=1 Tax=Apodemus speciosus TaxID=105296 RepID=A0ABQ0FJM4_APOSI
MWEETRKSGVKWQQLEHKGPYFTPAYEPLPDGVHFFYDGKPVQLSLAAEEVATFYGKMLHLECTTKEVFRRNFFSDWRKEMTAEERKLITHLDKCDFTEIHRHFMERAEARRTLPREQKQKLKEEAEKLQQEFGYCVLDGHREKIGNFKTEPPGLFRGRGDHPKMGMLKRRVMPEDVVINCSRDSKIPEPPAGHRWREVRSDNTVLWLAAWVENIQNSFKYIVLNPSSKPKGEMDWQKYEVARRLKGVVDKIRAQYQADWKSPEMKKRQLAVALYFIDKLAPPSNSLALRTGNEKEEGETADTVGCCSLRVEHVRLHAPSAGGQGHVVELDFLGKDSIRYKNHVTVEKLVFQNLEHFMEDKDPKDNLFDALTPGGKHGSVQADIVLEKELNVLDLDPQAAGSECTSSLNKHLQDLMEGLTAKVFRTYNASVTLQEQLRVLTRGFQISLFQKEMTGPGIALGLLCLTQKDIVQPPQEAEDSLTCKILAYNRANRAVAVLCNHQRAVPKTFEKSMQTLQKKIEAKKAQVAEARVELQKAETDLRMIGDHKPKSIDVATCRQLKSTPYALRGGVVPSGYFENATPCGSESQHILDSIRVATSGVLQKQRRLLKLEEQLARLRAKATDKEENKQVALGTAKLNYLDPRISIAWCKRFGVPVEKIYNKTQRERFAWAFNQAGEDFEF